MIEQKDVAFRRHESYQLKSIYATLAISPETYRRWERDGVAPRRDIRKGRWARVSHTRRTLARPASGGPADQSPGKPWLNDPLGPLSWARPPRNFSN